MSGRQNHSNRTKLALKARCPYTEYRQGYDPGIGVAAILERRGVSRTNEGTGAPANRGIS
jgi:hypothetical protein